MTEFMIQDATPRAKSIRYRLAKRAWKRGIANFFIDDIPFSFSTGQRLATIITQCTDLLHNSESPITVTELGAGLGILSKRLAALFEETYSSKNITLEVSDIEQDIVDALAKMPVFEPYKSLLRFSKIDGTNWVPKSSIDMMIAANLLDSFDSSVIEYKDGQFYELHVKATIPKDKVLVDTTSYPPTVLDSSAIKELIFAEESERQTALLSRLTACITEHYVAVPFEKSAISHEEQEKIKTFIKAENIEGPYRFNYSPDIERLIDTFESHCAEKSIFCIFDFGDTNTNYYEDCHFTSYYGASMYFNVAFPYIEYYCKKKGLQFWVSGNKSGQSQVAIISKGLSSNEIHSLESTLTREYLSEEIELSKSIQKLREKNDLEAMVSLFGEQKEDIKQSYFLNILLATEYILQGYFDEPESILTELINDYGETALSAYHALINLRYEMADYPRVQELINKSNHLIQYYSGIHHFSALTAAKGEDWTTFKKAALKSLATAPSKDGITWRHYNTLLLLACQKDDLSEGKALVSWILDTEKDYPSLLPDYLIKLAKDIHEMLESL